MGGLSNVLFAIDDGRRMPWAWSNGRGISL
jgi:hypothetical protein